MAALGPGDIVEVSLKELRLRCLVVMASEEWQWVWVRDLSMLGHKCDPSCEGIWHPHGLLRVPASAITSRIASAEEVVRAWTMSRLG